MVARDYGPCAALRCAACKAGEILLLGFCRVGRKQHRTIYGLLCFILHNNKLWLQNQMQWGFCTCHTLAFPIR